MNADNKIVVKLQATILAALSPSPNSSDIHWVISSKCTLVQATLEFTVDMALSNALERSELADSLNSCNWETKEIYSISSYGTSLINT